MWNRVAVTLVVVALVGGAAGCGSPEPPTPRVIVLGIDGLDAEVVDQLTAEGRLPNFARLRHHGAHGVLQSDPPMLSPILWTTMATGRTPDEHGIGAFAVEGAKTGVKEPVTSSLRRVKAVWDIASDLGRRVAVVGWWATWPPEPINGVMVSDHTCYHFLFGRGQSGAAPVENVISPPEWASELAPMVRRPQDITLDEASRFLTVSEEEFNRPFDFKDDVSHFKWALASADSYRDMGREIWSAGRPDLLMVYIEGTDSVSHLFGHLFRATGLAGDLAEQQRKYGRAVEEIYVFADGIVGDYLEMMDERSTLMVISDHGFKLGALHDDPTVTTSMRRVSEDFHDLDGIIYLGGRGVREGAPIEHARQLDITPTILHLLGLPAAADMPGRVLTEALDNVPELARVATYEDGAARPRTARGDDAVNREVIAHLEALGYLDGGEAGNEADVPSRAHADMLLRAGRLEEARAAFETLTKLDPTSSALHLNLAVALARLGRTDEALAALAQAEKLDGTNARVFFSRGLIAEQQGRLEEAAEFYRTTLRYEPDHEMAKQALSRLTGSARVYVPATTAEAEAIDLAVRGAEEARRGAYDDAAALLDRAEELAPELPLVHQYRANVAYLQHDLDGAIAALQRALELEPGNARVEKNLAILQARRSAGSE